MTEGQQGSRPLAATGEKPSAWPAIVLLWFLAILLAAVPLVFMVDGATDTAASAIERTAYAAVGGLPYVAAVVSLAHAGRQGRPLTFRVPWALIAASLALLVPMFVLALVAFGRFALDLQVA